TLELKSLEAQEKKLREENKQDTAAYKEVTAAIKSKNVVLNQANDRMLQLKKGIDLTQMSYGELRREIKLLEKQRAFSTPNSANWKKYNAQLVVAKNRFEQLKIESRHPSLTVNTLANGMNRFIGRALGRVASITAIGFGITRATDNFAEFYDKIADVQKTA